MQALMIKFTTPTSTRGARVKVQAGSHSKTYAYDHELTTVGNVHGCVKQFLSDMHWVEEVYEIGSFGDGNFCAVAVPRKFLKARDAVILARRAISAGENNGNVHCKPWGQAVTDLTDGVQPDGFAVEYASAVAQGF